MWGQDKQDAKRQTEGDQDQDTEQSQTESTTGKEGLEDISAFVGKGVDFKGTISYNGTVRIDGSLEGKFERTARC